MSSNQTVRTSGNIYETGEYLENNADWHVSDSPFKAAQVKVILDRNGVRPSTFVEVGCGAGAILTELSKVYPRASFDGFDISPQAGELSRARESEHIRFYNKDFLKANGHYDALLCMDVFEHVPDYMGFIRQLATRADHALFHIPLDINLLALLRGKMIESRKVVGHLHYFSRDTALATLRDCGYEIVDDFYTETFRLLRRPSIRNKLSGLIYRTVFALSKEIAVKLFGDCSLIVLARPRRNIAQPAPNVRKELK